MTTCLKTRARLFLAANPKRLEYRGYTSMADAFISQYARRGVLELKDYSLDLLEICVEEAGYWAQQSHGEQRPCLSSAASLLGAILQQAMAGHAAATTHQEVSPHTGTTTLRRRFLNAVSLWVSTALAGRGPEMHQSQDAPDSLRSCA